MKLAVISPEAHDPRETEVVHAMFAAGLERYHLRKPLWSAAELENWLNAFTAAERARIVIHSNYALADSFALGGIHERDESPIGEIKAGASGKLRTRACHDLECLRAALGRYDGVFLSPIFPSISKSGYAPDGRIDRAQLKRLLAERNDEQRRTAVFALGGIDENNTSKCAELGFDGVAVLGAIWNTEDPLVAFHRLLKASRARRVHSRDVPIMCLTQDGLALSHVEQARRLCEAGARWVQLRMKGAEEATWLETARAVRNICRKHSVTFVVNDSVDIALRSKADGVHLGKTDLDWTEARRLLGPNRIVGGTVNNIADAERACASGVLDYVGVGPWRFTANKKNLAPILGADGVRALIAHLDGLPAWVIGGIETSDLSSVSETGAAGVAVSSALFRDGMVEKNFLSFQGAWPSRANAGTTRLFNPVTTL